MIQLIKQAIAILCLGMSIGVQAQIAGNASVYSNSGAYGSGKGGNSSNSQQVYLNDSTLKISARLVINFDADQYIAVWGLQEEAESPELCNQAMTKRIEGFTKALQNKFKVSAQSIYIDIVSQSPVYEHEITGKVATQKQVGFELKKNLIHSFNDITQLDDMLALAASMGIYDLIKVDYIVEDQAKLYQKAFAEASAIILQKQGLYEQVMGKKLGKPLGIYSENFQLISPLSQYDTYTASESSTIQASYKSDYIKKQARKQSTSYYNGINGNTYDKITLPAKVKVGMQAVMELSVLFRI